MGRNFNRSPSSIICGGILDRVVADDFDLTCSFRLMLFDNEREKLRMEAMMAGMTGRMMGDFGGSVEPDMPTIKWDQM